MASNFNSPAFIGKVATLVVGVVILGVGLHSHFESSWVKQIPPQLDPSWGYGDIKTYKFCDLKNRYPVYRFEACPPISLERYFVAIIIISFVITLLVLIAEFVVDMQSGPFKFIDIGYHAIFAVLLLVAGIVYIVSAVQIGKLLGKDNIVTGPLEGLGYNFRKGEKIAAGVLTLIQSLLYGVTAGLIAKRSMNGPRRNMKADFGMNSGQ